MIIQLTRGMTEAAFRISALGGLVNLQDWNSVKLVIEPGQHDADCRWEGGSPWYLHGCWPGKWTDVDIANPWRTQQETLRTVVYDAYRVDDSGRIVFPLDDTLWDMPDGRYTGSLRIYKTPNVIIVNKTTPVSRGKSADMPLPDGYTFGNWDCVPNYPLPPPQQTQTPAPCVLAVFDIDLGPECPAHVVDSITVQFPIYDSEGMCNGDT